MCCDCFLIALLPITLRQPSDLLEPALDPLNRGAIPHTYQKDSRVLSRRKTKQQHNKTKRNEKEEKKRKKFYVVDFITTYGERKLRHLNLRDFLYHHHQGVVVLKSFFSRLRPRLLARPVSHHVVESISEADGHHRPLCQFPSNGRELKADGPIWRAPVCWCVNFLSLYPNYPYAFPCLD